MNLNQIPSATLVDFDVVGLSGSWNEADASFGVICIHGKRDDISLILRCFIPSENEKLSSLMREF
jgi:hypothetical protein